jgi:hypothetical protein
VPAAQAPEVAGVVLVGDAPLAAPTVVRAPAIAAALAVTGADGLTLVVALGLVFLLLGAALVMATRSRAPAPR